MPDGSGRLDHGKAGGLPGLHPPIEVGDGEPGCGEQLTGRLRAPTESAHHHVLGRGIELSETVTKLRQRDERRVWGEACLSFVGIADIEEDGARKQTFLSEDGGELRDLGGHSGLSCHVLGEGGGSVGRIDAGALLGLLDDDPTLELVDVREPDEFAAWSIPGAVNIPLGELPGRIAEVVAGTLVTVCAAGTRAQSAAELLADEGFDVDVLVGGMASWGRAYDDVAVRFGSATVIQIRRRGKGCLTYLIGGTDACLVIDPSLDIERILSITRARGWRVTHVADTHLHADHLSGARLLAETTGAQLVVNSADPFAYGGLDVTDDMTITLGDDVAIDVHVTATPGHTTGSTTFSLGDEVLFTGDTLFVESVGRPDLADRARSFAASLFDSLHTTVLAHPDDTLVLPAHFGPSVAVRGGHLVGERMGRLRDTLAALALERDEFIDWASSQAAPRPPNYVDIVEANITGAPVPDERRSLLEEGPNRCAVDTRP